jgi:hypothetical protein
MLQQKRAQDLSCAPSIVFKLHPHRPKGPQHVAELQVQFPRPAGDQPVRTEQPLHSSLFMGVASQVDASEEKARNAPCFPGPPCQFRGVVSQPIVQEQQHLDLLRASHQHFKRGFQRRRNPGTGDALQPGCAPLALARCRQNP